MIEILPVINVSTFAEVGKRIRLIESEVSKVHIDVADGSFTKTISWHDPQDLKNFATTLQIEIHFMVEKPEEKIRTWFLPPVFRIIYHYETTTRHDDVINACHLTHKEVGVAIRPDTSWEVLKPFIGKADLLQTLAVEPGPAGQKFDVRILEKLKHLRALDARMPLEVDGGVKSGIARACARAGATILAASHSLFDRDISFAEALRELQHDAHS